jgi:hypothetical protein
VVRIRRQFFCLTAGLTAVAKSLPPFSFYCFFCFEFWMVFCDGGDDYVICYMVVMLQGGEGRE